MELKDHVHAYERGLRATHRAFIIMCVVSLAILGVARTPSLLAEKLTFFGADAKAGEGIFLSSYAVVVGPIVIPILVYWCYCALARAVGLRSTLMSGVVLQGEGPETERLSPPLLGSQAVRRKSRVAKWLAVLTLVAAGLTPLASDAMLLWDYSFEFTFDKVGSLNRFNDPFALWFMRAGGDVVKPIAYRGVQSPNPPALLPWGQPWVYLGLLAGSTGLIWDIYRQVEAWKMLCQWLGARWGAVKGVFTRSEKKKEALLESGDLATRRI